VLYTAAVLLNLHLRAAPKPCAPPEIVGTVRHYGLISMARGAGAKDAKAAAQADKDTKARAAAEAKVRPPRSLSSPSV
jgi:hypothetical protein